QIFIVGSHMRARANVMDAPVHVLGQCKAEARDRAELYLAKVGVAHRMEAYPANWWGGEQQRVAMAGALAMVPEVMRFDV
ncbi:histidine/lysine/arginine/ornithine ABC transporter ATP-binding protein, partial [Pseudomonas sihuiensis]